MNAHMRRRNIDTKKAQSLNTQAGKTAASVKRPSSKTPSQPLTSKTGHSKNIAFSSANMPSSGTAGGNGDQTISSDEGDQNLSRTGTVGGKNATEPAIIEDINIAINSGGFVEDNSIVVEEQRNLHSKKHRR